MRRRGPTRRSRRRRGPSTAKASKVVRYDLKRAHEGPQERRLEAARRRLGVAGHEDAVRDGADRSGRRVEPDRDGGGRGGGGRLAGVRLPDEGDPSVRRPQFVGDRLRLGKFQSAAIDVNIGLDPDLYPLLGSTQVAKGGSNVGGIQDVALDRDLNRGPRAGHARGAQGRLQPPPAAPRRARPTCSRSRSGTSSSCSGTGSRGPTVRELGDPSDRYWDVLTWRLADGG